MPSCQRSTQTCIGGIWAAMRVGREHKAARAAIPKYPIRIEIGYLGMRGFSAERHAVGDCTVLLEIQYS